MTAKNFRTTKAGDYRVEVNVIRHSPLSGPLEWSDGDPPPGSASSIRQGFVRRIVTLG